MEGTAHRPRPVWRSDDGGENWQVVSYDRNAMGRAHYYTRMASRRTTRTKRISSPRGREVDRRRADDAGSSGPKRPAATITTCGSIPTNANRMMVGTRQGLSITVNRGRTWYRQRLPNAQIYHVTVDNEIPYNV